MPAISAISYPGDRVAYQRIVGKGVAEARFFGEGVIKDRLDIQYPTFSVNHPTQSEFFVAPGRTVYMPVYLPHEMKGLAVDLNDPDHYGARMIVRGFVNYRDEVGSRRLMLCYWYFSHSWVECNPNNAALEYDAQRKKYSVPGSPSSPTGVSTTPSP